MPDELFTDWDSNQISKALRDAIEIKGIRGAPDKMNVQQLQPTVDVLQGGFARYEILNLNIINSMSGALQTVDIFDPTLQPESDSRNNREFEIRILFMEIHMMGLDAITYADNDRLILNVRQEMQGFSDAIDGIRSSGINWIKRWKANLAPDEMSFSIPSTSAEGSADDAPQAVNNWAGWIPAGTKFSIRIDTPDVNFPGGAQVEILIQAIRTPKRTFLPV